MANITFKEAKELFEKYNEGRKVGIVFDAVLETMVELINRKDEKKSKKKPDPKPEEAEKKDEP